MRFVLNNQCWVCGLETGRVLKERAAGQDGRVGPRGRSRTARVMSRERGQHVKKNSTDLTHRERDLVKPGKQKEAMVHLTYILI